MSTIALPGDPNNASWGDTPPYLRAGGDLWIPGSYDADLNLFCIGTAQAKPWVAASREMTTRQDALYTNSTLALNPRTGQVEWYFQHAPDETLDLDIVYERVLVDADGEQWLFTIGKDGILWKLDRRTGAFVDLRETLYQDIYESIDRSTGWERALHLCLAGVMPRALAVVSPGRSALADPPSRGSGQPRSCSRPTSSRTCSRCRRTAGGLPHHES